jgi:prepilin-type N-terminal cleavage/methylation domain-containing protein
MKSRGRVQRRPCTDGRSGFTLLEVLAALVVLGVATGIFASLFVASMNLGHLSQSETVAATLAEEQLVLLRNHPQGFAWPDLAAVDPGSFAPVAPHGATEGLSATFLPSMMLLNQRANDRDHAFYERYSWQTFARLPEPDSGYLELAVVIAWAEKGKPQRFVLTSAIPRNLVEAAP